jgi:hypothetical protein
MRWRINTKNGAARRRQKKAAVKNQKCGRLTSTDGAHLKGTLSAQINSLFLSHDFAD